MSPEDAFLAEVRRAMAGMEPAVREDILRELRSHLSESVATSRGDVPGALARLGSPREVGRSYRDLYGYGRAYRLLFAAVAFLLAIPSVPVLRLMEESLAPYGLSLPVLAVLVGWLLWVGVAAGSRAGLLAGVAALVGRFVGLGLGALSGVGPQADPAGLALFAGVSVLLVVLGWLPGTAKKVWSRPRAEL